MDRNEVLKKLNEIICDELDLEEIELTENSSAKDFEKWDSLRNLQIVVSVEHEFGIRFYSDEIPGWQNIGEMIDSIISKIED